MLMEDVRRPGISPSITQGDLAPDRMSSTKLSKVSVKIHNAVKHASHHRTDTSYLSLCHDYNTVEAFAGDIRTKESCNKNTAINMTGLE